MQMTKLLNLASFLVIAGCALGQNSPPAYVVHGACADGLPTFQQWFNQTPLVHGAPYDAKDDRQRQVLLNYPKVQLQMTQEQVEQLLGLPDFSVPRSRGHLSSEPEPAQPSCSAQFAYVLRKTSDNMADTTDQAIYLFFSPDNKLTWAIPQALPGLKTLGGPSQ